MEDDEIEDISNELRRQYEEDRNKRCLSESPEQNTTEKSPKNKKRQIINEGSDEDADVESDAGISSSSQGKKFLHSTLKEDCT